MDWRLIRTGLVRDSLLLGGGLVVLSYLITGLDLLLLGFAATGLLLLLLVGAGLGSVHLAGPLTTLRAGGLRTGLADPDDHRPAPIPLDLRLFFVGIDFVGFGLGTLFLVGQLAAGHRGGRSTGAPIPPGHNVYGARPPDSPP